MIAGDSGVRRHTRGTGRFRNGTTGSKGASGKLLSAWRWHARDGGQRPVFPAMVQIRLAIDQGGSIGMCRPSEHVTRRPRLHQAAAIHDRDALGDLGC